MLNLTVAGILESNAINFIILLMLILVVVMKTDVKGELIKAVESEKKRIADSNRDKRNAEAEAERVKAELVELPKELEKIVTDARKSVVELKAKVETEIKEEAERFERNAEKAIETEVNRVISDIQAELGKTGIQKARNKIVERLQADRSLHRKLIAEAIDEIEGLDRRKL